MKDFFTEFRNDHRQIRDLIMDLMAAFIRKDMKNARLMNNGLLEWSENARKRKQLEIM
jgi:hypothetical protein